MIHGQRNIISALSQMQHISHKISQTVRERETPLFKLFRGRFDVSLCTFCYVCGCIIFYLFLWCWNRNEIFLKLTCVKKKYGSKEKENVLFCFACLTFFSITIKIIDGWWVCAGDPGRVGVVEEYASMCISSVCVCVCVGVRSRASLSERISQLLYSFPLLHCRLGFSRISAGSQNS